VPSSTFSSSARTAANAAIQLAAFAAGSLLSLTLAWGSISSGVLGSVGIDPAIGRKWLPSLHRLTFSAYTRPNVSTGKHFVRRRGRWVEEGRVLAEGAEAMGSLDHPYGELAPVRVSFGRYGFRDEFEPAPGGTAVLGASYVEAAFADAEDTIPGWLHRDHGVTASNFGVAFAGGFTALHILERYVLPTRPARVVWIFAERAAFERLVSEHPGFRARPRSAPPRPGFAAYVDETLAGFRLSGLLRARRRLHDWFPLWVDPLPPELAPLHSASRSPHGSFALAEEEIPVDVALLWKPEFLRIAPRLLAEVLAKMNAMTGERGIEFRVVYIPSRLRLLEGMWVRRPAGREDLPDLFEIVARECRKLEIPVTDATPALRARLAEGVLVINPIHDQHLNAAGMRVVAGLIAED
jgi:hypothetical protein